MRTGVPPHITEDAEAASTAFDGAGKSYTVSSMDISLTTQQYSLTFFSRVAVKMYLKDVVK